MSKRVLWITQTGVLVALLIVSQAVTSGLSTLVTGSIVNLILIVGVMVCGLPTGVCVAALSPIFAKFFGIGPLWALVPFIMLGNLMIVVVWHVVGNMDMSKISDKQVVKHIIACVCGAVFKFLTLFILITKFAVPVLLQLEEPQASVISAAFSVPQLITALIGGGLAIMVIPVLRKALENTGEN